MALGNVFIEDLDGNIGNGVATPNEGICGLLFDISAQTDFWTAGQGLAIAEKCKDTVVELNTLADADELGITPYGSETPLLNGIPYYHIQKFFERAGGSGRLFLMFADCKDNWDALTEMQSAAQGMIFQFGVWTEQHLWEASEGIDPYGLRLVTALQSKALEMANVYHAPASILLSANTAQVKGEDEPSKQVVFSKIPECLVNARYVTVLLSQSTETEVRKMQASLASATPVGVVGLALGVLSQASVGHCIGWVGMYDLAGSVPGIEMGFGDSTVDATTQTIKNSTRYTSLSPVQADALEEKGYLFMNKYAGYEGHIFFHGDPTCSNGDFNSINRNRTINKSRRMVRQALLPYVNSPIKVDPANGNLTAAQITVFKNIISSVLDLMTAANEISGTGTIDVPASQNILVTKELKLSYSIVPLGCARSFKVEEQFAIKR